MRVVLVCGGRDFSDKALAWGWLDCLHQSDPITRLVEGGAKGADRLAAQWAFAREVDCATYQADWRLDGYSAGPIRNRRMFLAERPNLVVAFPGGRGTAHMIGVAIAGGCPVIRFPLQA